MTRLLVLLAIAAALFVSAPAWCETPWCTTAEDKWQSSITPAVVELIRDRLVLTTDQSAIFETYLSDHRQAFTQFLRENQPKEAELDKAINEAPKRSAESLSATVRREEVLAPLADKQGDLDEAFLDQVALMLDEEQLEQWSAVRQEINRLRWLRRNGLFTWEWVDLAAIARQMEEESPGMTWPEAFPEALARYCTELDVSLRRSVELEREWSRTRWRTHSDGVQAMANPVEIRDDRGEVVDVIISNSAYTDRIYAERRQRFEAHERVAEINRTSAGHLPLLLPPEQGERFRAAAYAERFRSPESFAGLAYIANVLMLDSLSSDQRRLLETQLEHARRRASHLGRSLANLHDEIVEERFKDSVSGGSGQSRIVALMEEETEFIREIRELERSLVVFARPLLTVEQQEAVAVPRLPGD